MALFARKSPPLAQLDPLALLHGLVIDDDGSTWASSAADFEFTDAAAILAPPETALARRHYLTRPRGGHKTTGVAALLIVILLVQAPPRSTSLVYASDREQAGLLLTAFTTLVQLSGLGSYFDIRTEAVIVKETGARLLVQSADAPGAWGRTPYIVVCDEFAQWPQTDSVTELWHAILSSLPKRPDSRFIAMTTAGQLSHFSHSVLTEALTSDLWHVNEVPGPLPWIDPADLAEQRRMLPPSVFARVHLNIWMNAEDSLITDRSDLTACIDGFPRPLAPGTSISTSATSSRPSSYVVAVDGARVRDWYAITVGHPEWPHGFSAEPVLVLDVIETYRGSAAHPLSMREVGQRVLALSREYGARRIIGDSAHLWESAEAWAAAGVDVRGLVQRTQRNNDAASSALFAAIRSHRLRLPDDPSLIDELLAVRLSESRSRPGVFKLDVARGAGVGHGDRAATISYLAAELLDKTPSHGSIFIPGVSPHRATIAQGNMRRPLSSAIPDRLSAATGAQRPAVPIEARARQAVHNGDRRVALRGAPILNLPGTANDPSARDGTPWYEH